MDTRNPLIQLNFTQLRFCLINLKITFTFKVVAILSLKVISKELVLRAPVIGPLDLCAYVYYCCHWWLDYCQGYKNHHLLCCICEGNMGLEDRKFMLFLSYTLIIDWSIPTDGHVKHK